MNIKITDRNGVTLKTANTFVKEDIAVAVDLPQQEKSVTPTKSVQEVVPDSNYDGLIKVTVGAIPDEYIVPSGELDITENGTSDVTNYASVNVNVQPTLQEKGVTPTKVVQEIIADTNYDGLSKVTVETIPDEYIIPSGNLNVMANGIYDVKTLETVTVAIPEWDGSSENIVSGYTLNLVIESTELLNSDEWGYSLDNGSSYNQFTSENMSLQNVTDIMFKASYGLYRLLIGTTSGAQDIENLLGESDVVHTLTANTTWYLTRFYDAGGYD